VTSRIVILVVTTFAMAGALAASAGPVVAAALTYSVNRIGDAPDLNAGNGKCDSSTATGSQCTLRAAIQESNATPSGTVTINFKISSSTTSKIIAPTSPLPTLTRALTINGYSQAGTSLNTKAVGDNAVLRIVLSGTNAGSSADGLVVNNNGPTLIEGLVIQKFGGSGVSLVGSHTKVEGCFIGTNAAGTVAAANGTGVTITGSDNVIGESAVGARDIVSGNSGDGILITGADAIDNSVLGDYIGTTKSGAAQLGNGSDGISITGGGSTRVGANGFGSVISGNGSDGISISGSSNDVITSNLIGTNAAGDAALPNDDGIASGGGNITIGGTTAADRNVVSGNKFDGVSIYAGTGTVIEGNYIGRNAANDGNIGNGLEGVFVAGSGVTVGGGSGAANLIIGNGGDGILLGGSGAVVQGNAIQANAEDGIAALATPAHPEEFGPNTIGPGNVILGNSGDGVVVIGSNSARQTITANQIFTNGKLGINLAGGTQNTFGVTANDTGDADSGANGLQNFPVISAAVRHTTGITTISYSINSTASKTFTIEFFVVPNPADASSHGESIIYLGHATVTTDVNGNKASSFTTAQLVPGQLVTATATRSDTGDTSEFSANFMVSQGQ
jgi:hypothetical protein